TSMAEVVRQAQTGPDSDRRHREYAGPTGRSFRRKKRPRNSGPPIRARRASARLQVSLPIRCVGVLPTSSLSLRDGVASRRVPVTDSRFSYFFEGSRRTGVATWLLYSANSLGEQSNSGMSKSSGIKCSGSVFSASHGWVYILGSVIFIVYSMVSPATRW